MEQKNAEDLIRRLAAALRGTELYSPAHPLVQRGIDALTAAAVDRLQTTPSIVITGIARWRRAHNASMRQPPRVPTRTPPTPG